MNDYATIESQLENGICSVEDTEEIFWLKMADDYQSKVKAGDLLVRQYRFRDAISVYQNALKIKEDDFWIYLKSGGAFLTLLDFENAEDCYNKALEFGAKEGTVAFYWGILNFFQGKYTDALENFEKADANDNEMLISVVYWHTITSFRTGAEPTFLRKYDKNIDVGHHTAYKKAVSVFTGEAEYNEVDNPQTPLDAAIILFGLSEYLKYVNKTKEAEIYAKRVLECVDVWPSIAYLAAYNDANKS